MDNKEKNNINNISQENFNEQIKKYFVDQNKTKKKGSTGYKGGIGVKLNNSKMEEILKKSLENNEGFNKLGYAPDVQRTPLQYVDPAIFDPITTFIQYKSRKELNFRFRYYYSWQPLVHNIINLHSSFPLSDFTVSCEGLDKNIERSYNYIKEELNLVNLFNYMLKDYYLLGEAIAYGRWDDVENTFKSFVLYPPEQIMVKSLPMSNEPLMFLEPDDQLKKIVNSENEIDKALAKTIDPSLRDKIRSGKTIPLPPQYTTQFPNKMSMYDVRGTSLIKPIFKDLMYEDKLRLLQTTLIDRHSYPIKIFKLGNPNSVSGDHRIFIKDNKTNETKIISFDDFWKKTNGHIIINKENNIIKMTKHLELNRFTTLQYNGRNKQVWEPIESIHRHKSPKCMKNIKTTHAKVEATESHGLMWLNPYTCKYESVPICDLEKRKNPTVVSIDNLEYRSNETHWGPIEITPSLSYIFGIWITDGGLEGRKKNCLRFTNTKLSIIEKIESLAKNIKEISTIKRRICSDNNNKKSYIYRTALQSKILVNLILKLLKFPKNNNSVNKSQLETIPHSIMFHKSNNVVGALLAGIIDGDGSVSINKREIVIAYKTSKKLMDDLGLCLLARGITSQVTKSLPSKNKNLKIKGNLPLYRLKISNTNNINKLWKLVNYHLAHKDKKNNLKRIIDKEIIINNENHYSNCYDLEISVLEKLKEGCNKNLYKRSKNSKKRLSSYAISNCKNIKLKNHLLNFYCENVHKIENINPTTEYVYDLCLKNDPHTYLIAGQGWIITHNTGWIPNKRYFEEFRNLLMAAANDPDFSIIWNHGIDVDYVGTKDKIMNLIPEFEFVEKRILTGLFANKALAHGEGLTFANSNVSVRVLMHRYLLTRNLLERFARHRIFKPIAEARKYYTSDVTGQDKNAVNINGKYKSLIIPDIKWQKLNLLDDTQQKNFIMQLLEKNLVPAETMLSIMDLDPKIMKDLLKQQEGTHFDPIYNDARKKASSELTSQVLLGKKDHELGKELEKKEKKEIESEEMEEIGREIPMVEEIPTEERKVEEVTPEPEEETGF